MSEHSMKNPCPLLVGDYSDPTIVRVGSDYYMTHSTNQYAPSLLIWHSTNLRDWQPVGFALDCCDGDVWAPEIVHYNDLFYIYYTVSGRNKVITSRRIEGPWNAPIDLEVPHIDPGHVVDSDGRRYIYLSGGNMIGLSDDGLRTVGEMKKAYDGWPIPVEWRIEGIAEEGPKLFWRDGWCYLVTAQGGTAGPSTSHMAVVARSKSALGPWENSPRNPLIRTHSRNEQWWSRGHGTIIDSPTGDWFVVYHAYLNGYVTLGRSTLIQQILWTPDGWPSIEESQEELLKLSDIREPSPISLSDDFDQLSLKWQWRFFGEFDRSRFKLESGELVLNAQGTSLLQDSAPLCMMPRDRAYEVEVEIEIDAGVAQAGLMLFYDRRCFTGLAVSDHGVRLQLHGHGELAIPSQGLRTATLKLVNDHHEIDFWAKLGGSDWIKIRRGLDTAGWNHNTLGGFMSLRPSLYCSGEGSARFKHFRYSALSSSSHP